jgi:hypothetical protein
MRVRNIRIWAGCGVLCLVEYHHGVAERAAAHEGQRGNLYDVLLHHVLQPRGGNHVLQSIVQRLQIRVDLVLHVAGEEAQLLAGLHRRTAQDDLLDGLLLQGLHRRAMLR